MFRSFWWEGKGIVWMTTYTLFLSIQVFHFRQTEQLIFFWGKSILQPHVKKHRVNQIKQYLERYREIH